MLIRIISGIILLFFAIALLFYAPPIVFIATILFICILAMWEWNYLAKIESFKMRSINLVIYTILLIIIGVCIYASFYAGYTFKNISIIFVSLLVITNLWYILSFGLTFTYPKSKDIWTNNIFLKLLMGYLSITSFFVTVVFVRLWGMSDLLLYVLLLVCSADSGAYFVGKQFGKHKLIPNVSPGKTREGALGGVLLVVLIGIIAPMLLNITIDMTLNLKTIIFLVMIAIFSIQGDLLESMLKREAGIKDSSNLIPGHGGILDRLDSMLFVMPFIIFCSLSVTLH